MDILFVGLQYVSVALSFFFIAFVSYQKKSALCSHLLLYSTAVLVNGLSYLFELKSNVIEEALMAIRFEYFGLSTAAIAALLFICELFEVKLKNWLRGLFVFAYFISCVLVSTNHYHHLHYRTASLEVREHVAILHMKPGPVYAFHTIITLSAMAACIGVIVYACIRDQKRRENYRKYLFLGMAAFIPFVSWLTRLFGSVKDFDMIPFGLFCTNACFILIIYFFRIFDVAENAKNEVLDTLEEGILVCDEEGEIVYENKRIKEIFQKDGVRHIAGYFSEMEPTEEGEFRIENRYFTITESEVYEGNRSKGKTWCFIDVTQTKERENQLKELSQVATSANNAKSNFLANMSHEIRTPINTILGMNEMILNEAQSLNVLEYARNVKNEGKTLMSLINELLDFSKIESGKMELPEDEYKTSFLIHDIVTIFSLKTKEKGLEFRAEIAEDLPVMLYGDEIRLKQIFGNLLTNAVKYTERGTVGFHVSWEYVDEHTAGVCVTVSDTGIGIHKEELEHIFEKFKRLDSKRNNKIEGTGLGMNITAQLLNLMNGDISIESEYGVGSKFKVTIPQKIVDGTPIGSYDYSKKEEKEEVKRVTFTAPNGRILVVDDNIMNRVVVKGLLKHTLLQVEEAGSGAECLEKTMRTQYNVILLDHMMPEMDGVETLQRLKLQEGLNKETPVIVLTANAVAGVKDYYINQGFDDYMSKPISGKKLERMLLQYLPDELVLKREVESVLANGEKEKKEKYGSEQIRNVLSVERIDLKTGLENFEGKKDMYRETARVFVVLCEKRLRTLHEYIRQENVPAYASLVRAIKEDAQMLGAKELAELAWEQEQRGREGNLSFLKDKFALLSAEYQRLAECYNRLFDGGKEEGGN